MLKRKVYQELLKWKENTEGKALCIIGARQIGKTTLIREFGKNEYEHFAEINFVTDEKAADIFNDRLTAEVIITNLTAYLQTPLEPETVQLYIDTHDIAKVVQNQRSILELYRLDIAKYAEGSDKAKIKAIFDSIPAQLNEKNRRFKLNSINASARHIRYEDSFNWLADAGVALPCYNVTEPQAPLQLSEKRNLFKLYMNDVGLHTELVEIKSGSDFKKHLAMDHAMKVEQWEFEQSIVFSKSNIEKEADVLYLPWYMILFFMQEKEPEKLIYEIDLSGL